VQIGARDGNGVSRDKPAPQPGSISILEGDSGRRQHSLSGAYSHRSSENFGGPVWTFQFSGAGLKPVRSYRAEQVNDFRALKPNAKDGANPHTQSFKENLA
jgi:hypothetical protein